MNTMLASNLLDQWPRTIWEHRKLLVGVSGGADSVALLLALCDLSGPKQIVAAHFNHGWRGAESDADEQFVLQLCAQREIQCITKAMLTTPLTGPSSLNPTDDKRCRKIAMQAKDPTDASEEGFRNVRSEESARRERYEFLKWAAYECGASYVLTAHTADDRIETLLHNLFRGTGLSGASSLRQSRPFDEDLILVRPLLSKTRQEILSYLNSLKQSYREDSSNRQLTYSRNFIRHEVLPAIRKRYPHANASLLRFSELAEETLADIQLLAELWLGNVADQLAGGAGYADWPTDSFWVMPRAAALGQTRTVLREALRQLWLRYHWPQSDMSRAHWQTLQQLMLSPPPPAPSRTTQTPEPQTMLVLPGNVRVESRSGLLAIGRRV